MSQTSLLTPSAPSFPPLTYQNIPVLTTEMLAQAYEVEPHHIRQNFKNNRARFIEGKHFFLLSGNDLREFKNCVENFYSVQIGKRTASFILWTDRGCARHAKSLNTDRAWDMYELLEETFFRVVRPVSIPTPLPEPATCQISKSVKFTPSTAADRAPLRSIVNAWARVSGLPHDALWPQVRAAFNLARIDELPAEWVPDAIAWVQAKIDALPRPLPPAAPVTPPAAPSAPAVPQPVLSAELDRYAAEFEAIARHIEQLPGLLLRVERVASSLVSDACRRLAGADRVRQVHLDAALTDMLDGSRRMADDLIPRARLGINVMRDLAQAQGR